MPSRPRSRSSVTISLARDPRLASRLDQDDDEAGPLQGSGLVVVRRREAQASSSPSSLVVFDWSTGMPGPIVVVMVAFEM